MDRNLHIISVLLIALTVLGICSCKKGGTHHIEVNVGSITMEKEGGEVGIEAKESICAVYLWSRDKTIREFSVEFDDYVIERYGGDVAFSDGFVTPETLIIEANDWMSIVVPPYSPASGLFNFKIMVKENDSGASRDGWLFLCSLDMGETQISFKQPNL